MIKRKREVDLQNWYKGSKRKPLIIRGARQVGKSTLVREFAKNEKLDLLEINLEKYPQLENTFKSLNIKDILTELSIILGKTPGNKSNCLLFLDEIQTTPSAIQALRYFYEERSDIPVIAAGSLLEFALKDHSFSMPVGRIEYLFLGPLTFSEFLIANKEASLDNYLQTYISGESFSQIAHEKLLKFLRLFIIIGGMPEAVFEFICSGSFKDSQKVHHSILNTYEDDFSKYASGTTLEKINYLFKYLPSKIGEKFKYSNVNSNWLARDIRNALHLLEKAGLIFLAHSTSGEGIPISANIDTKTFKPYFLDIGLANTLMGYQPIPNDEEFLFKLINEGKMAEQFIAQNLLYANPSYIKPQLHYWLRDNKKGNAEIDFLIQLLNDIVPIEVKAGKSGSLKSLHQFIYQYKKEHAIRMDINPPSVQELEHSLTTKNGTVKINYKLFNFPLYMIEEIQNYLTT